MPHRRDDDQDPARSCPTSCHGSPGRCPPGDDPCAHGLASGSQPEGEPRHPAARSRPGGIEMKARFPGSPHLGQWRDRASTRPRRCWRGAGRGDGGPRGLPRPADILSAAADRRIFGARGPDPRPEGAARPCCPTSRRIWRGRAGSPGHAAHAGPLRRAAPVRGPGDRCLSEAATRPRGRPRAGRGGARRVEVAGAGGLISGAAATSGLVDPAASVPLLVSLVRLRPDQDEVRHADPPSRYRPARADGALLLVIGAFAGSWPGCWAWAGASCWCRPSSTHSRRWAMMARN